MQRGHLDNEYRCPMLPRGPGSTGASFETHDSEVDEDEEQRKKQANLIAETCKSTQKESAL